MIKCKKTKRIRIRHRIYKIRVRKYWELKNTLSITKQQFFSSKHLPDADARTPILGKKYGVIVKELNKLIRQIGKDKK